MLNSARDEMATTRRLSCTEASAWAVWVSSGAFIGVRGSKGELLVEDTLLEVVFGIEQEANRVAARLLHFHLANVSHLVEVGRGADRPFVRVLRLEAHPRGVGEDGATPSTRTERADGRQRQHVRVQRQDRTMGGEVVGGRAGRRAQQDPVTDQLVEFD